MIKCEIVDSVCKAEIEGRTVEIALELAALIGTVYSSLSRHDPDEAALFRMCMKGSLQDNSPVWKEDPGEGVSMLIPMRGNKDGD